jgi:ADP-ribosylation factor 1/2
MQHLIGWMRSFWAPKECRILLLGLSGAGKTTLLYRLFDGGGKREAVTPTLGFNVERIRINDRLFMTVWDLSGDESVRRYWSAYYSSDTVGCIFVVDAAARHMFPLTKDTLDVCMKHMKGVPFLVLSNKMDLPNAFPLEHVAMHLGVCPCSKAVRRAVLSFLILQRRGLGCLSKDVTVMICQFVEGTRMDVDSWKGAMTEVERQVVEQGKLIRIQSCSILKGANIETGIDWLARNVAN